jgi:hypothetical protein
MKTILFLFLILAPKDAPVPWGELSLSIERDHGTSGDHSTLCRVRVVNHGPRSWPGRAITFEARALDAGVVVARERGRFGLTLAPYGTLETLIAFTGRYDRFEVSALRATGGERRKRSDAAPRRRRARAGAARFGY